MHELFLCVVQILSSCSYNFHEGAYIVVIFAAAISYVVSLDTGTFCLRCLVLFGLVSSEPTLNGYPCSPVVFWPNFVSLQLALLFWLIYPLPTAKYQNCLSGIYDCHLHIGPLFWAKFSLDPCKPLNSNPVEGLWSQELCEIQQKSTWFPHFVHQ